MNCERALEACVAELAGETADRAALSHLASCSACNEAAVSMRALWSELGLLPDVAVPATLRARVQAIVEASRLGAFEAPPRRSVAKRLAAGLDRLLPAAPVWRLGPVVTALVLGLAGGALWERGASRSIIESMRQELQSTRSLITLSLLQDRSPTERLRGVTWGATSGGTLNPDVVAALLETLNRDPSVDVRLAAVDALSGVRDMPVVQNGLLESLPKQKSPLVQIALIDALVSMHEPRAVPVLRELATDTHLAAQVRGRARQALLQFGS